MIETGLMIAQIAFLALLYLFIWAVVRGSSRQIARIQPPPIVAAGPVVDPLHAPPPQAPAHPPAAPIAPMAAEAVVAAPVAEPLPPVASGPAPEEPAPVAEPAPDEQMPPEVHQPTLEPFPSPLAQMEAPPVVPPAGGEAPTIAAAAGWDDPAAETAPAGDDQPSAIRAAARRSRRLGLDANISPRLVVDSSPALEVGSDLPLEGGLTIGRSGAADLSIADQYVSHMHARIVRRGPYYFIEDLGSTNGSFLNDLRIDGSAQLKVHDALRMGQTVLRYEE